MFLSGYDSAYLFKAGPEVCFC